MDGRNPGSAVGSPTTGRLAVVLSCLLVGGLAPPTLAEQSGSQLDWRVAVTDDTEFNGNLSMTCTPNPSCFLGEFEYYAPWLIPGEYFGALKATTQVEVVAAGITLREVLDDPVTGQINFTIEFDHWKPAQGFDVFDLLFFGTDPFDADLVVSNGTLLGTRAANDLVLDDLHELGGAVYANPAVANAAVGSDLRWQWPTGSLTVLLYNRFQFAGPVTLETPSATYTQDFCGGLCYLAAVSLPGAYHLSLPAVAELFPVDHPWLLRAGFPVEWMDRHTPSHDGHPG